LPWQWALASLSVANPDGSAGFAGLLAFLVLGPAFSPAFAAAGGVAAGWDAGPVCAVAAETATTKILVAPSSLKRGKMLAFMRIPPGYPFAALLQRGAKDVC
ncbi:MAG: hypothetical protein ACLPJW_03255, partial [Rhodomicrobium sp.]